LPIHIRKIIMRKVVAIEVIILIAILALVLPLAISVHNTSVTKYNQSFDANNAARILTFDLQTGQIVTGSYTVTDGETNTQFNTGFSIYDPDGAPLTTGSYTREPNHGSFMFTATITGQYYLSIPINDLFIHRINYQYSITNHILGIDTVVLIGLVIIIGVVSGLIIAFISLYRAKKMKKGKT
jgi:hypothetical protein